MKIWMFALIVFLAFSISQARAEPNPTILKTYHVEVQTLQGPIVFAVRAPNDSVALISVYIGAIYNKRFKKISTVTVKETGLSTTDFPQRVFVVRTDDKSYALVLNLSDAEYAMTAIQASRLLMSRASTRDIQSRFDDSTLKSRMPKKYTLKYKGKEISYLLNVNTPEEGVIALDIAARVAERGQGYLSTSLTSVSRPVTQNPNFNCVSMFQH